VNASHVIALLLAMLAAPATAHPLPGAGAGFAAGVAHPLLGLDHLLAMVAVGLWAGRIGDRARWAVPLSFISAMLAGCALGFTGLSLPHIEPMIAASVLVLGLLVCTNSRSGVLPSAVMVSLFAVFHGLAHANEIPEHGTVLTYVLGFTVATAMLHTIGLGAAARLRATARLAATSIALAGFWMLANTLI
jgi:urease accessory protein